MKDEFLDLVNEEDEVIGRILRSEAYEKKLSNFRCVNAFIIRSDGKMWVPRRTATKKIFSLALDFSLGEHVESGENYEDAFRRGLREELNLNVDSIEYKKVGLFNPHENGVAVFMTVYEIYMDQAPDYNTNDFVEGYWLLPSEIIEKIDGGEKAKGDLIKVLKNSYL